MRTSEWAGLKRTLPEARDLYKKEGTGALRLRLSLAKFEPFDIDQRRLREAVERLERAEVAVTGVSVLRVRSVKRDYE